MSGESLLKRHVPHTDPVAVLKAYRSGEGSYVVVEEPQSPNTELLANWDACGLHFCHTGAVSSAVALHHLGGRGLPIHVQRSGDSVSA